MASVVTRIRRAVLADCVDCGRNAPGATVTITGVQRGIATSVSLDFCLEHLSVLRNRINEVLVDGELEVR